MPKRLLTLALLAGTLLPSAAAAPQAQPGTGLRAPTKDTATTPLRELLRRRYSPRTTAPILSNAQAQSLARGLALRGPQGVRGQQGIRGQQGSGRVGSKSTTSTGTASPSPLLTPTPTTGKQRVGTLAISPPPPPISRWRP